MVSALQHASRAAQSSAPTFDDLLEVARELRPRLLAEQGATEQRGTFSAELHQTFRDSGLYRIQQPRRYGGHELDVPSFMRIIREVARGCPGSAWCFCLSAGHHIQMAALFPETVQDEVYGSVSEFLAPARPIPMGTAEWADGSWRVNGEWDYCSGAPYATHAILAVRVQGPPATEPLGLVVVPRDQWTMLDDWAGTVIGMAGSGSNSVRVEDAVVPAEYLVGGTMMSMRTGADSVGYQLHGNPMFCGQSGGYSQLEIAAILVGTARAAADEYERLLRTKMTSGPSPQPKYTAGEHQRAFASVIGLTDAAEDVLDNASERYMSYCFEAVNRPEGFSQADSGRTVMSANQAMSLASEAVDLAFKMAGSSEAARSGARMQRYYRDFSMARTNVAPKLDMESQAFSSAYFAV